jgi:hypothetical protein
MQIPEREHGTVESAALFTLNRTLPAGNSPCHRMIFLTSGKS